MDLLSTGTCIAVIIVKEREKEQIVYMTLLYRLICSLGIWLMIMGCIDLQLT